MLTAASGAMEVKLTLAGLAGHYGSTRLTRYEGHLTPALYSAAKCSNNIPLYKNDSELLNKMKQVRVKNWFRQVIVLLILSRGCGLCFPVDLKLYTTHYLN